MENYWNLYCLYVERCQKENYSRDVDPEHYEMEWNHFFPQCIFGEWPIGHWLTFRQHSIASALQTLAFNRNCMFSTHKRYLPPKLLELAWPYFREARRKNAEITNAEKDELGRSVNAVKGAEAANAEKDELGRSIRGVKGAERTNAQIWESTIDGFRSGPGPVAYHNKANGWDPKARIRIL
jgi:hypothetical protein